MEDPLKFLKKRRIKMYIKKYVWVVNATEPFEYLGVVGVFSSKSKAEKIVEELEKKEEQKCFGWLKTSYFVTRIEINKPNI